MWFLWFLILGAFSYLLGSIPFGVIIAKWVKGVDLREVGSGNIGTANAIRALGPFWGGMVFAGDVLKGVIPVQVAIWLPKLFPAAVSMPLDVQPYCHILAGLAAIAGHNNSIFLKFKGGKGIATSAGVFASLNWMVALIGFSIFLVMVAITKYSSVGSLTGALSVPIAMFLLRQPAPYVAFAALAAAIAFYKHRENINRLMQGKERKITEKAEKME